MSATVRKMKMAELRVENDRLRDERNGMIRTNTELLSELDALRSELDQLREKEAYARQTIAEQEKRIAELDQIVAMKHDALVSYDEFYNKCASLLGYDNPNPATEMDEIIHYAIHNGQRLSAVEAERDAWREDATELYRHLSVSSGYADDWSVIRKALAHHKQLHERYSTEKSDTEKGE